MLRKEGMTEMNQIYDFLDKQAAPMNFDDLRKQQEEIAKQIKANQAAMNKAPNGPTLDQMKEKSQSVTDDIVTRGKQQQAPINEPKPESTKPSPNQAKPAEPTKPKAPPAKEVVKETATVSKAKPKIGGKGLAGLGALGLAGAGAYALNKKKKDDAQVKTAGQLFDELVKVAANKKSEKEEKAILAGSILGGAGIGAVAHGKKMEDVGERRAKQMIEFAPVWNMTEEEWVNHNKRTAKKYGGVAGGITGALLGAAGGTLVNKGMRKKEQEKTASEIYTFLGK